MTDTAVQFYGNSGHHGPSSVPEPERNKEYRWGIRVDSDIRGPQDLSKYAADTRQDAIRYARRAAEEHRGALRELGIGDAVVPWIQAVTTVRTTTVSEHEDLEAYR